MKLDTKYADIQGTFQLCLRCRECTFGDWPDNYHLCPIHNEHRIFTASAGGLIAIMTALSQNKMEYSSEIAKLAYECNICGSCDVCEVIPLRPPYTSPTDLIRFLRYQLVKKGLVPQGELRELFQKVKENGDYLGEKLNLPKNGDGTSNKAVLFAECLHDPGQKDNYRAAIRLLGKMKLPTAIFSHGGCCGATLYDLGFWDELKDLLRKRSKDMDLLNQKDTIFLNPHCQEFMTKRYPQISEQKNNFRPKHISELLAEALKSKKFKIKNHQQVKVSYHDPCYLGKELGIYDPPREALSFLDGVNLIEMPRNRKNSYCCGAGGAAGSKAFPDFSCKVTLDRIKEFKETGADLLITACPHCKTAFQNILPAGEKNRVKDLVDFVDERVL